MPNFTYHSGPVISNIEVTAIYARTNMLNADGTPALKTWIDSTDNETLGLVCTFNNFMLDLVNSAYFGLIGEEYSGSNTPFIGTGVFIDSQILDFPINQTVNTSLTIPYKAIEDLLQMYITQNASSPPNPDSCYMVLMNGTQVSDPDGLILGKDASGFHHAFTLPNGAPVVYCVVDASGYEDATTYFISHELAEAATNPFENGWFDEAGKEICDVCAPNLGEDGSVSLDDLKASGATFHGHLVCPFWSRKSGNCTAPPDDNLIRQGPYLTIGDARPSYDGCAFGIIEGTQITFKVSGALNSKPIGIHDILWTADNAQVVSPDATQPKYTVTAPAAGQMFTVHVTAMDDWGCSLSMKKDITPIAGVQREFQELACKLRHEILSYWRFIDPLWDPLRDFTNNPVSPEEFAVTKQLINNVNRLSANYRTALRVDR